jgi:hypothetical protein
MIGETMFSTVCLATLLSLAVPLVAAQPPTAPSQGAEATAARAAFLKRAEAAFTAREAKGVAALADMEAWRAAGYPELSTLQMFLPPGPIVLEKELAPLEVLYKDGNGRSWRLVLRVVKGELRAVVRAEPCPRGVALAPRYARAERPTPKVQSWTLLECWPLPK